MGWGTYFKPELYISRKLYKDKDDLEYDINDLDLLIKSYETKLMMFAVANPRDIITGDVDNNVEGIYFDLNILLKDYAEAIEDKFMLTLLRNDFETRELNES